MFSNSLKATYFKTNLAWNQNTLARSTMSVLTKTCLAGVWGGVGGGGMQGSAVSFITFCKVYLEKFLSCLKDHWSDRHM